MDIHGCILAATTTWHTTNDVTDGMDISNVYYLPGCHNLGVLVDGSMHWGSNYWWSWTVLLIITCWVVCSTSTTPTCFRHLSAYMPERFVRLLRDIRILAIHSIDQWNAALGAGGGIDYHVWHGENSGLAIRVAQADYIYSNYNQVFPFTSPQWNSIRLSAGLVMGLGNYYTPPPTAACTAQPTEVTEGEPVTVTATGTQLQPQAPTEPMPGQPTAASWTRRTSSRPGSTPPAWRPAAIPPTPPSAIPR